MKKLYLGLIVCLVLVSCDTKSKRGEFITTGGQRVYINDLRDGSYRFRVGSVDFNVSPYQRATRDLQLYSGYCNRTNRPAWVVVSSHSLASYLSNEIVTGDDFDNYISMGYGKLVGNMLLAGSGQTIDEEVLGQIVIASRTR